MTDTEQRFRDEANREAVRRKVFKKHEPIEVPKAILEMTQEEYTKLIQKNEIQNNDY